MSTPDPREEPALGWLALLAGIANHLEYLEHQRDNQEEAEDA